MTARKKMVILSIPPPYGGGEIRAKLLHDFLEKNKEYIIITNSNDKKNKSNQGKLSFQNIWININYIRKNCQKIWRAKPSVVYISIPKDFFPLLKIVPILLVCKMVKAKLIGELAGRNFYFLEKSGFRRVIGRYLLKRFNSIRVLGNSVKKTLENSGLQKTVVIDNGIELSNEVVRTVKSRKPNDAPLELLFIGALNKNKGIYVLLEIIKKLSETKISIHANIVGEWSSEMDKANTMKFIRENELADYLTFHGLLLTHDKWRLLSKSDIFVFPSFNEGQPLVLIEAMAFGMPIVSSTVGAIPDTIENGVNGFMIEEHDANQYFKKIVELSQNVELYERISNKNIETYENRFTSNEYCLNIQKWINEIAQKR